MSQLKVCRVSSLDLCRIREEKRRVLGQVSQEGGYIVLGPPFASGRPCSGSMCLTFELLDPTSRSPSFARYAASRALKWLYQVLPHSGLHEIVGTARSRSRDTRVCICEAFGYPFEGAAITRSTCCTSQSDLPDHRKLTSYHFSS